jgi:hypothetical protein
VEKSPEAIKNIYNSFKRKQQTTEYLRMQPLLFEDTHSTGVEETDV